MTKQLKNTLLQTSISIVLMVGTGIVMLSSQIPIIRKVSEYSVHIMLGMLGFSLLSLLFGKSKMMFAGMACTAALCIFLKDASNNQLKLPEVNTEAKLNVAHINLSNINNDFSELQYALHTESVDLVSFQELTPDWNAVISESLKKYYPYNSSQVRIDPYGMAIYSKHPFVVSDTFTCHNKPNLKIKIKKDKKEFQVISSYLTPALDQNSIKEASDQLKSISKQVNKATCPNIVLGEYNMVYWTNEIREFRTETNLTNSRRGLSDGNLRVPYDHIFFSDGLECTQFKEMRDKDQNYIGIMGSYQIKGKSKFRTLNGQLSEVLYPPNKISVD